MIIFRCKSCNKQITVEDKHAGKKGRCPACEVVNDIPASSSNTDSPEFAAASETVSAMENMHSQSTFAGVDKHASPDRVQPQKQTGREEYDSLPIPAMQMDAVLNRLRPRLGTQLFNTSERIGYLIGVYGLAAMAMLAVVASILRATIKDSDWRLSSVSDTTTFILFAFGMMVCQYVVGKIRAASLRVIESSPSKTSSSNITDCLSVFLLLGALATMPIAIIQSIQYYDGPITFWVLTCGALMTCVYVLIACLALNPQSLNVIVDPKQSAGAEAMGLLSFVLKLALRIAPLLLGALVILAAIGLAQSVWVAVKLESSRPYLMFIDKICPAAFAFTGLFLLVYLACLFEHLMVDVMAALFQIRDNTAKNNGGDKTVQSQ